MPIERIVIDNFKSFRHLDLPLNAHMWTAQSFIDTHRPLCA